jgi:hypothetical protein
MDSCSTKETKVILQEIQSLFAQYADYKHIHIVIDIIYFFFLAFFWYKSYISILQIQSRIILLEVPLLKYPKYNNLEYWVWVQWHVFKCRTKR